MAVPKALSAGEETLALHLRARAIYFEREFQFLKTRKFRFDFAFPDHKLAVEVEGGIWRGGRHSRGTGFENDAVKYNLAVLNGWRVLRYSTEMVVRGDALRDVIEALSALVG